MTQMTHLKGTAETIDAIEDALARGAIEDPITLLLPIMCNIAVSIAAIADKVGDQNV